MTIRALYAVGAIEKFAFNGLRAMLVLFLVGALRQGDQRAIETYSYVLAFSFVLPLLGSLAARLAPEPVVIETGLAVGAFGFVLMLTGGGWIFEGLSLVMTGTGFARSLIPSTLGRLVRERDPDREQAAFSTLYACLNAGTFLGAIVLAGGGEKFSWNLSFGLGAAALAAGAWLAGCRSKEGAAPLQRAKVLAMMLGAAAAVRLGFRLPPASLDAVMGVLAVGAPAAMLVLQWRDTRDLSGALTLFALSLGVFLFFGLCEHSGTTINVFTDRFVDRGFFGSTIPTTFFQALDPAFNVAAGALMVLLLSSRWGKGAPSDPTMRLNSGYAALAAAFFVLGAAYRSDSTSPWTLVLFYGALVLSETLFVPAALALVSARSLPERRTLQMALLYVMIGTSMWWSAKVSSHFAPARLEAFASADFLALFSGLQRISLIGCLGFAGLYACAQLASKTSGWTAGGR